MIDEFARRFGVEVIDAFGSTEGAVALNHDAAERAGAMGLAGPTIRVVTEDGEERTGALRRRRWPAQRRGIRR